MTDKPLQGEGTLPNTFAKRFFRADNDTRNLTLLIVPIVILGLGFGLFFNESAFLRLLKDRDASRGLITFIVTVTTASIALILALYAVAAADANTIKERFSLGKEVLMSLVGILGTVLGFYFGSADKAVVEQFGVAEVTFLENQVRTHLMGGTPPFHYSITAGNNQFSKIDSRISKDGWIWEALDKTPSGTRITIDISDAKGGTLSKAITYPTEPKL